MVNDCLISTLIPCTNRCLLPLLERQADILCPRRRVHWIVHAFFQIGLSSVAGGSPGFNVLAIPRILAVCNSVARHCNVVTNIVYVARKRGSNSVTKRSVTDEWNVLDNRLWVVHRQLLRHHGSKKCTPEHAARLVYFVIVYPQCIPKANQKQHPLTKNPPQKNVQKPISRYIKALYPRWFRNCQMAREGRSKI